LDLGNKIKLTDEITKLLASRRQLTLKTPLSQPLSSLDSPAPKENQLSSYLQEEDYREETLITQLLKGDFIDIIEEEEIIQHVDPAPWFYSLLSMDGGGIRGYIPALILEGLQEDVGSAHSLHSLFDFIGGTSVGGILALGLTIPQADNDQLPQYQISDLTQLFAQQGERIFPQTNKVFRSIQQISTTKYSPKPLEGLLQEYFQDTPLSAALTPTLVTTWCNHSKYLSYDAFEGFAFLSPIAQMNELDDYLMWEVARSTSAAPTYFPGYQIKNLYGGINSFIEPRHPHRLYTVQGTKGTWLHDGGLWYNNPSKLTFEALQELYSSTPYRVTNQNCIVVSLGTGQVPSSMMVSNPGFKDAIAPLIQSCFEQKDQEVNHYFKSSFGKNYYRLQPRLDRDIPLDNTSEATLQELEQAARSLFQDDQLDMLARRLTENKANKHPAQLF